MRIPSMLYKLALPFLAVVALAFAVRHVIIADQVPPKLPPPVEPTRAPFKGVLAGAGMIEPRSENIAIGAHLPGIVAQVLVEVGDSVEIGQELFRIDDRQLQAELEVRKAILHSAQESLAKLKAMPRPEEVPISRARVQESEAMFNDAREQFERAERGFRTARTNAISEDDYSRKKNAVDIAKAQVTRAQAELKLLTDGAWKADLTMAEAQVKMHQAQVQQTQTELKRLRVTSPIKGTVLQKNIRSGEYVGMPASTTLMIIGDISTLHVRMDVDDNDIGRFRTSLRGKAITRGANKQEFPLTFVRLEPYVIPKRALTGAGTERVDTRVLQVIYAIDKKDASLFVGQQVDVYLDLGESK